MWQGHKLETCRLKVDSSGTALIAITLKAVGEPFVQPEDEAHPTFQSIDLRYWAVSKTWAGNGRIGPAINLKIGEEAAAGVLAVAARSQLQVAPGAPRDPLSMWRKSLQERPVQAA